MTDDYQSQDCWPDGRGADADPRFADGGTGTSAEADATYESLAYEADAPDTEALGCCRWGNPDAECDGDCDSNYFCYRKFEEASDFNAD